MRARGILAQTLFGSTRNTHNDLVTMLRWILLPLPPLPPPAQEGEEVKAYILGLLTLPALWLAWCLIGCLYVRLASRRGINE